MNHECIARREFSFVVERASHVTILQVMRCSQNIHLLLRFVSVHYSLTPLLHPPFPSTDGPPCTQRELSSERDRL